MGVLSQEVSAANMAGVSASTLGFALPQPATVLGASVRMGLGIGPAVLG